MGLFNFLTQEIAMDLGTANTLIIHNDEIVVNEPSIVALDRNNPKNVLAVGKRALMMHEKTHESIRTVRPLKDGVIADFNAAELMIREMIKMIYPKKPLFPPSWRMMICIPSSITEVEKRAVRDSAEQAGAKEVYLIHEPMAAALGIGIDVEEPVGNMIIDIGGGTTGITVIALAGIVCDQSIRIAGDEFTADIMEALRRYHSLLIGERTAEQIKSTTVQDFEIQAKKIYLVSKASTPLPLQPADSERALPSETNEDVNSPLVSLNTRLNNRVLDLRAKINHCIFILQDGVDSLFQEFLRARGFIRIHTPKIIGAPSEGIATSIN